MSRYVKPYKEEFKRQAVEFYMQHRTKPVSVVARELGISDNALTTWIRKYSGTISVELPEMTSEQLKKEVQRLNREVIYLQRQREILKKAVSIFSNASSGDMP